MRLKTAFILFLLLLLGCSSFSLPEGESQLRPAATVPPTNEPTATRRVEPTAVWYEGGTLHDKTVADWLDATSANRLATAGDWTAVLTTFSDMTEARLLAEDLRTCVDGSAEAALPEMKVGDLAAACAILMGWGSN